MNVNVTGGLLVAGILAGCVIIPPFAELFFEWLYSRFRKESQECKTSLQQIAAKKYSCICLSAGESIIVRTCILLYLGFNFMAVCMLALKLNLMSALSLQAFGFLAMFVGEYSQNHLRKRSDCNRLLKEFLILQPVLFAVATGFFFATGSFTIADSVQQPRLLIAELPLLFLALIGFSYLSVKENLAAGMRKPDLREPELGCSFAVVARRLAEIYRLAFFLLLSGMLMGYGVVTATAAALILYALMVWAGPAVQHRIRRGRFELNWKHVFFAVGVNLTWLYIKYF